MEQFEDNIHFKKTIPTYWSYNHVNIILFGVC